MAATETAEAKETQTVEETEAVAMDLAAGVAVG